MRVSERVNALMGASHNIAKHSQSDVIALSFIASYTAKSPQSA